MLYMREFLHSLHRFEKLYRRDSIFNFTFRIFRLEQCCAQMAILHSMFRLSLSLCVTQPSLVA